MALPKRWFDPLFCWWVGFDLVIHWAMGRINEDRLAKMIESYRRQVMEANDLENDENARPITELKQVLVPNDLGRMLLKVTTLVVRTKYAPLHPPWVCAEIQLLGNLRLAARCWLGIDWSKSSPVRHCAAIVHAAAHQVVKRVKAGDGPEEIRSSYTLTSED